MSSSIGRTLKIILFLCAIVTCAGVIVLPERKLSGVGPYPGFLTGIIPFSDAEKNLTGVPLYPQPTAETCGETAFLMAWNYVHSNKALDVRDVILLATQKGWYLPLDPTGVYTSPAHMRDMANYYASQNGAQSVDTGQMTNSQQALMFLFSQIVLGHPVIVDVTTVIGDTDSQAHFVVVTGVSLIDAEIFYNDPFGYIAPDKHQAHQARADWTSFWTSWSTNGDDNNNGNGWYMIVE